MEPKEFCYWLQGFSELSGTQPTLNQWAMIKEHLQLVFTKVTAELGEEEIVPVDADTLREIITKGLQDTTETIDGLHQSEPSETSFCMSHGPLSYPRDNICADVACAKPSNKKLC